MDIWSNELSKIWNGDNNIANAKESQCWQLGALFLEQWKFRAEIGVEIREYSSECEKIQSERGGWVF